MNYIMLILSYLLLRMKEMQEKGKKGKNVSKHFKLICKTNDIDAYITTHCAVSLI